MQQQPKSSSERIAEQIALIRQIKEKNPSQKLFSQVENQLLEHRLVYAIFLYGTGFLSDLLNSGLKSKYYILGMCQACCPDIFGLEKDKIAKDLFEEARKTKQFQQGLENKKIKLPKETRYTEKLLSLIKNVALVVKDHGKNQEILKNALILGFQINCDQPDYKTYQRSPFGQYATNYVNFCLENVRKNVQKNNICCKTSYRQKEQIQFGEGPSQEFKRYTWPINNLSIKNHLTKTIVGFLNSKGGIIFIGIMETKEKKNDVVGIALKPTQVQPIKDLIKQLAGTIYPRHEGFGIQKSEQKPHNSTFNYQINDYIKMQFIKVVEDKETFTYLQQKNQKNVYVADYYIVKIIVKIGHPKHLYHIINNEKNIDFFERKDRNVEKMQFPDAYDKIYDKLDKFEQFKGKYRSAQKEEQEKVKYSLERHPFHSYCRYEMYQIKLLLKQDEMDEDEDDDDDE